MQPASTHISYGDRGEGSWRHLHASLRAASTLERTYQGFDNLAKRIVDGNVTAIADLIFEATNRLQSRSAIQAELCGNLARLDAIIPQALSFLFELCGIDETNLDSPKPEYPDQERVTFDKHFATLYQLATGWLGWTPEQAWRASPKEITEAFKGRTEMLQAIFGGGTNPDDPQSTRSTERDPNATHKLRLMAASAGYGG